MSYLVDTNVISEVIKLSSNTDVLRWLDTVDADLLFASVITLGEIRMGIENLPEGRRRRELESWFETGMPEWFATNVLPMTKDIADRWGRITVDVRRQGYFLTLSDRLIAATALEHELTLVTRNAKDFARVGVPILNPWGNL